MYKMKRKGGFSTPVKIMIIAVLVLLVIFPLVRMFTQMTPDDLSAVIKSPVFSEALINSVVLSAIATAISVILALILAFSIVRTGIKWKGMWNVILTLPMLIPSISHGMGLIILFGGNGILKNLLGLQNSIYGNVGIVVGSVMYAFPVAYIMLADVLKYQDTSIYDAADILGIGKVRQFLRLTLPYLARPLAAATFSSFAMIVTDYGVPLMIGGKVKTLSLLMYQEVIGQLQFGRGCVYGLFLIIPAVIAFVCDLLNKERGGTSFVKASTEREAGKLKNGGAYAVAVLVSLLALLPIAAFVILAFAKSYPSDMTVTLKNFTDTMERGGLKYFTNSLVIALLTATAGTVLSYACAYLTSRMKSSVSRVIHMLVLAFMAIPGIVLGLSYVTTFSGSALYGTLFIIVMVNTAHFMSSPYLMMYNSFGKMNGNLEAVGATLGISRMRMIKDVFVPQSLSTIVEMFTYLFVNCMMTISAVSFLATVDTKPISLMINQFEAQRQYECAAVVSILILVANIIIKAVSGTAKTIIEGKKAK